jgi:hypothetical protein
MSEKIMLGTFPAGHYLKQLSRHLISPLALLNSSPTIVRTFTGQFRQNSFQTAKPIFAPPYIRSIDRRSSRLADLSTLKDCHSFLPQR